MTFGNFTDYDKEREKQNSESNTQKKDDTFGIEFTSNKEEDNGYASGFRDIERPTPNRQSTIQEDLVAETISNAKNDIKNLLDENTLLALCWVVPIISLILLVIGDGKKNSARWHTIKQSILFGVLFTAIGIIFSLFITILGLIPIINGIAGPAGCAGSLLILILGMAFAIAMGIKTYNGELPKVPLLGNYVDQMFP